MTENGAFAGNQLLHLNDVSIAFGKKEVIRRLTFSVGKGEFVALVGPSGSGKSTIFNMIGGLLEPNTGTILLDDQLINGKRGSISYMPQTPSLLPWRTILDNVMLGQELLGQKNVEKAKEMLSKAGLGDYGTAYPHELSGGMQQRAAFIRALLSPQEVICLDEPFSALDEFTRVDMQKWLQSVWEQYRKTILFVTHNIEEALFLADRILVLSDKPAYLMADFEVPFSRPRSEELLLDDSFSTLKRRIFTSLKK